MLRSIHYTRTPSSTALVTATEVRDQLRMTDTLDDSDLIDMAAEAVLECEMRLGDRSLLNSSCIDYFDCFEDEMELHWSPASVITGVTYVDSNGTTQTLANTVYELGTKNGMGILRLKYDQTWPTARSHEDVIAVSYTAGYGSAPSSVPINLKRWVKARAAWLFENRDGEEFPFRLDALLSPQATGRVVG